jgi:hypothetical protein
MLKGLSVGTGEFDTWDFIDSGLDIRMVVSIRNTETEYPDNVYIFNV